MICPKCKNYVEVDDVIFEESNGSMEHYYCHECNIWVNEHGNRTNVHKRISTKDFEAFLKRMGEDNG